MLHEKTVENSTLKLLKDLQTMPMLKNTRLVGGTALALQYGHRQSIDLDFFGSFTSDNDELVENMRQLGSVRIISMKPNIKVIILNGVKIDIVNYKYRWIDEAVKENDLSLASPKDISAMKVNAIEGRGTKKDFIDLYFLLQHYSLNEILGFYALKYPDNSSFRALMSMGYFDDAEPQPMPKMLANVSWNEIKSHIKNTLTAYKP